MTEEAMRFIFMKPTPSFIRTASAALFFGSLFLPFAEFQIKSAFAFLLLAAAGCSARRAETRAKAQRTLIVEPAGKFPLPLGALTTLDQRPIYALPTIC